MGIKKLSELIVDIVLLITGVALWLSAQTIDVGTTMGKGSDFMPKLCATLWVFLAAVLLVQTMNMPSDAEDRQLDMNLKGFLLTILSLIVYTAILPIVGFTLASILYMFAQTMLYLPKAKRTKKTMILVTVVSVVLPIAVNAIFVNAFALLLPAGILF